MSQSQPLKNALKSLENVKNIMCDYIATPTGHVQCESFVSHNHVCEYCNGHAYYVPFFNPSESDKRCWLCKNGDCACYEPSKYRLATKASPTPLRELEWALFCEINGIGDVYHDVKYDNITQSDGKMEFLHKFSQNPTGLVLMQGSPGTGKTFCCLGICEKFTKSSSQCVFCTQKQLFDYWLETFRFERSENLNNRIQHVHKTKLLVIDDFGTGEISQGFMTFFMDLINTRMQWLERATIVTTNLDNDKFTSFCGEALIDRMNTGQKLLFSGKSRRQKVIL